MKIGNVNQGKGVGGAKRAKGASKSGSSAFADQLRGASGGGEASGPEAGQDAGMVDHAALDGVDALLAMQEVGDATDENARRQGAHYGEELLERLKTLQDALLMGGIPKDLLMDMAQKVRAGRAKVQDQKLNSLLDEIELRVEVEIAKHTRRL